MPDCFARTISGRRDYLRAITDASDGLAAAVKFNLAFFEALGAEGWRLLHDVREMVPGSLFVIADAKRGDISSSAMQYAKALYSELGADSATVNPLMGRDAVEPFLEFGDRLTFVLALTSNPSASEFLDRDGLAERIAAAVGAWSAGDGCVHAGLVIGATRAARIGEIREIEPRLAALIPGLGAQGGDVDATVKAACGDGAMAERTLFHVTRGVLPGDGEVDSALGFAARVREKIGAMNATINAALATAGAGKGGGHG